MVTTMLAYTCLDQVVIDITVWGEAQEGQMRRALARLHRTLTLPTEVSPEDLLWVLGDVLDCWAHERGLGLPSST